jgi:AmiR/NasT family two-component response regulator
LETDDDLKHENEHLRLAVEHRDVIGQAKGILMERHGIGAEDAFQRLVKISQDTNTKLHEIAAMVTGAMDAGGRSERIEDA